VFEQTCVEQPTAHRLIPRSGRRSC
jgi:hypothetical protein